MYLINMSLQQGVFPDELKIAKVNPIFKSGDVKLVTNYRPVSVLQFQFGVSAHVQYTI